MGILFILIQFEIINDIQIILKKDESMKKPPQEIALLRCLAFVDSLFLGF